MVKVERRGPIKCFEENITAIGLAFLDLIIAHTRISDFTGLMN